MVQTARLSTKYTLSYEEQLMICFHGCMRRCYALMMGRSEPSGSPTDPWRVDIEGAAAEYVVSKYTGLVWHTQVKRISQLPGDVGHLQVRQTRHEMGCLILNRRDHDEAPFMLVTGTFPHFQIQGWIYAGEGKQDQYWRTENVRTPAYFVPQGKLSPPDTWPRELG